MIGQADLSERVSPLMPASPKLSTSVTPMIESVSIWSVWPARKVQFGVMSHSP